MAAETTSPHAGAAGAAPADPGLGRAGSSQGSPAPPSPMLRRRVLARELKKLRRAAGLTHTEVARRLGWQQGKVSKIESARQGVGVEAVIALVDICGADAQQREQLVQLAHDARAKAWWESYSDVLSAGLSAQVGFEAGAARIRAFAAETVPELLRTRDYAAAVLAARGGGSSLERRLELLLERQRTPVVERAVELDVVLAESVLRRVVGGPGVLAAQLHHLVALGRQPNVTLRVLPFTAGATAVDVPFSVLSFDGERHPDVVCVPSDSPGARPTEDAEVEDYRRAFRGLRTQSLSVEESQQFLADVGRGHGGEHV